MNKLWEVLAILMLIGYSISLLIIFLRMEVEGARWYEPNILIRRSEIALFMVSLGLGIRYFYLFSKEG